MLMVTREGSSCNNNRRLTRDMQQAKSLRGTWREYIVSSGRKLKRKQEFLKRFYLTKKKTLEAASRPPSIAWKAKNWWMIYRDCPAFFPSSEMQD